MSALIAEIPDYPLPGVSFKDVTPISGNADATLWVNNEISNHSHCRRRSPWVYFGCFLSVPHAPWLYSNPQERKVAKSDI